MRTELYWIDGPWPGRLAIMPRPRGGDWLEDEIQSWRRSDVDLVLSLLTSEEQAELSLASEGELCRRDGIDFLSFPVVDRGVPSLPAAFARLLSQLTEMLVNGKNVAVHCRQGIGRAALVAIGLLILAGLEPSAAIAEVRAARGCAVPETPEQSQWIADFAKALVTKP